MGLISFFQKASETIHLGPEGAETPHANYHQRIVRVSGALAVIGGIVGIAISLAMIGQVQNGKEVRGLFVVPGMFAVGGFMFGMALMCLFAPREFLDGPAGRKWMALIGTQNITAARIVCFLFGLVVTAAVGAFGIVAAVGN
jgi:hypothetical protein